MLRVGLTGNIAAGKSSVARLWRDCGATVIDADVLARKAVEPGTRALEEIVAIWGDEVLDSATGALDRSALRRIVFTDPEARTRLESIVHPEVQRLRQIEHDAAEQRGEHIVVDDVPLLFEAGLVDAFDVVVLVDAPGSIRRERIVRHRGLAPADAERMIAAQIPASQKRLRANWVIENAGTPEDLVAEAEWVWRELIRRAGQRG